MSSRRSQRGSGVLVPRVSWKWPLLVGPALQLQSSVLQHLLDRLPQLRGLWSVLRRRQRRRDRLSVLRRRQRRRLWNSGLLHLLRSRN